MRVNTCALLAVFLYGICPMTLSFAEDSSESKPETLIFDQRTYQQDMRFSDEEKKYFFDLDGVGEKELVWTFRAEPTDGGFPRAFTLIYGSDKKLIKTIRGNMRPDSIELLDLDGKKLLVIFTTGGNHYTSIAIYQYQNDDCTPVFEEGSASGVTFDKDSNPPVIKIGRGDWGKEGGWAYADEPLWEVYKWNGERFVYSKDLSNTEYIGEMQDIENSINSVTSNSRFKNADINGIIPWIAGAKAEDFPDK